MDLFNSDCAAGTKVLFFKGKGRFAAARGDAISTGKVTGTPESCIFNVAAALIKWVICFLIKAQLRYTQVRILTAVLAAGIWIFRRALCSH